MPPPTHHHMNSAPCRSIRETIVSGTRSDTEGDKDGEFMSCVFWGYDVWFGRLCCCWSASHVTHEQTTRSVNRDVPKTLSHVSYISLTALSEGKPMTDMYPGSFPWPCKMPRCHTLWFSNVILTLKWETVLGKYWGYWFSQAKRDHI